MAIFHGTNGNDTFTGTPGASDTVTFAGNAAGYEIALTANGRIQVSDIDFSNGNTGVDMLSNIDRLSFADRTYAMRSATQIHVSATNDIHNHSGAESAITTLADGGFVVAWTDWNDVTDYTIYSRRYDQNGHAVSDATRVSNNNTNYYWAYSPATVALADGGYLIVWDQSYADDAGFKVYGQRFDAAGNEVGGEFLVNSATDGEHQDAAVTVLPGGGFVVTWTAVRYDGSFEGIYAQRYDPVGNPVGGETWVNTTTAGTQWFPEIATLADGGYLIVWESNNDDYEADIRAQRFDAAGNKVGGETRINSYTEGNQEEAAIAALSGGGHVVAWKSDGQDGSGSGVYAQRYDAAGNKVGGETLINTTTVRDQTNPAIAALAGGGYVIVWESGISFYETDVRAQRFDAAGNAVGGETRIKPIANGYQSDPSITAMDDGGYTIAWSDGDEIFSHRYTADGQLMAHMAIDGTGGDDIINGGAGAQEISGLDGHDRLFGRNGEDILIGGRGDDLLDGGGRNDVLSGGLGRDTLIGGNGADVFSFGDSLVDGANVDTVNHFLRADADLIQLDNAIFARLIKLGTLGPGRFVASASGNAVDDNDFILYETGTGNLYYDRDGNGAGEKVKFAVIGNKAALTAADFEVI